MFWAGGVTFLFHYLADMPKKKSGKGKQIAAPTAEDQLVLKSREPTAKHEQFDDRGRTGNEQAQLQYYKTEALRAWVSIFVDHSHKHRPHTIAWLLLNANVTYNT